MCDEYDYEDTEGEDWDDLDYDVEYDTLLERQEMEDFAQDGYFENIEAWEIW